LFVSFQGRSDCITAAKVLKMIWGEDPTPTMPVYSINDLNIYGIFSFFHVVSDTNIGVFLCQNYNRFSR